MMYISIKDLMPYMEQYSDAYLNEVTGDFISGEMTGQSIPDLLKIPKIDNTQIKRLYVSQQLNIKSLMNKLLRTPEDEFIHSFHLLIENSEFADEWYRFYESKLLQFAADWCNENNIRYTL